MDHKFRIQRAFATRVFGETCQDTGDKLGIDLVTRLSPEKGFQNFWAGKRKKNWVRGRAPHRNWVQHRDKGHHFKAQVVSDWCELDSSPLIVVTLYRDTYLKPQALCKIVTGVWGNRAAQDAWCVRCTPLRYFVRSTIEKGHLFTPPGINQNDCNMSIEQSEMLIPDMVRTQPRGTDLMTPMHS